MSKSIIFYELPEQPKLMNISISLSTYLMRDEQFTYPQLIINYRNTFVGLYYQEHPQEPLLTPIQFYELKHLFKYLFWNPLAEAPVVFEYCADQFNLPQWVTDLIKEE